MNTVQRFLAGGRFFLLGSSSRWWGTPRGEVWGTRLSLVGVVRGEERGEERHSIIPHA